MRILIVDDDPTSRMAMKSILVKFGRCDTASNGGRGLDEYRLAHFANDPFDLIILDYLMPDLNGPEVLTKIRRIEQRTGIPKERQAKVIMVTVRNDLESVKKSLSVGCQGYVVKPFNSHTINENVIKLGYSLSAEAAEQEDTDIDDEELREIFIQEFGNRINRLKDAVETNKIDTIQIIAHQLHGTGATYGFDEVTTVGSQIETAAKKGDWSAIKSGIDILTELFQKYNPTMKSKA